MFGTQNLALFVVSGILLNLTPGQDTLSGGSRTAWDGVFTEAQALRGQTAYEASCASCHQVDLSGGVLVGDDEAPPSRNIERLVERRDVDTLFTFVRKPQ